MKTFPNSNIHDLSENWYYIPLVNRMRIYEHMSIIKSFSIEKIKPDNEYIKVYRIVLDMVML